MDEDRGSARVSWLSMAYRNLLRNRRRSTFTALAIAIGFCSINLFGGFTRYVFTSLKEGYIYAQASGHLTISRPGTDSVGLTGASRGLFPPLELARIRTICRKDKDVIIVTQKLFFRGLLSNGDDSTVFLGVGFVCADTREIGARATGMIAKLKIFDGQPLSDSRPERIGVSRGLARKLHLDLQSRCIAMASTVSGQINALDAEVTQFVDSPSDVLDDMLVVAPVSFVQSLYDSDGVDRVCILLDRRADVVDVKHRLQKELDRAGLSAVVETWYELDRMSRKIELMFRVIFSFIFFIVLVVVTMSVVNTMGMAVSERTREIGTLRALGVKRHQVIHLFTLESALLGLFGCLGGAVLTLVSWMGIEVLDPQWTPPLLNRSIPLEVYLVPEYLGITLVMIVVLCIFTARWPARNAAYQPIVDALGHI